MEATKTSMWTLTSFRRGPKNQSGGETTVHSRTNEMHIQMLFARPLAGQTSSSPDLRCNETQDRDWCSTDLPGYSCTVHRRKKVRTHFPVASPFSGFTCNNLLSDEEYAVTENPTASLAAAAQCRWSAPSPSRRSPRCSS